MRFLKLPEVIAKVGLQKTAIYGLVKEGKFPKPVRVLTSSVWVESEIEAWMREAVAARP